MIGPFLPYEIEETPVAVNPDHYAAEGNPWFVGDFIDAAGLNFGLGNAVKYIARAGKKTPEALDDLRKAKTYLDREIEKLTPDVF